MIKDLRFDLTVASLGLYCLLYAMPKTRYMNRHREKYSDQDLFDFGMDVMNTIRRHSRTTTIAYNNEIIPQDETVVFYANHQGKYDAVGILSSMGGKASSVLWEQKRADRLLAREMAILVQAVLIDLESMKGKVKGIVEAIEKIKSGSNMLIFPEGKTDPTKKNALGEFQSGCFACSLKTKTTIVPVAIYDSYKAMNGNSLIHHVTTQVHFLEPIRYEQYKDMSKQELCDLVEKVISEKMATLHSI